MTVFGSDFTGVNSAARYYLAAPVSRPSGSKEKRPICTIGLFNVLRCCSHLVLLRAESGPEQCFALSCAQPAASIMVLPASATIVTHAVVTVTPALAFFEALQILTNFLDVGRGQTVQVPHWMLLTDRFEDIASACADNAFTHSTAARIDTVATGAGSDVAMLPCDPLERVEVVIERLDVGSAQHLL